MPPTLKLLETVLCRKQQGEIGLDASKIMTLMLKIKVFQKIEKTKNWCIYFMKTHVKLAVFAESLRVDHAISKRLIVLGIIQTQEH